MTADAPYLLNLNTPLQVATSRYHAAEAIKASGLVPIATSIGTPRWKLAYPLLADSPARGLLAPWGLLGKDLERDEFEQRYTARLEKHSADKILHACELVAREHDAPGVVLLCWEDVRKPGVWCHRQILATWLEEQVPGLQVPELPDAKRS